MTCSLQILISLYAVASAILHATENAPQQGVPPVTGCPGAQRGVPVDLARHKGGGGGGGGHCGGAIVYHGVRGAGARTKNSRVQAGVRQTAVAIYSG